MSCKTEPRKNHLINFLCLMDVRVNRSFRKLCGETREVYRIEGMDSWHQRVDSDVLDDVDKYKLLPDIQNAMGYLDTHPEILNPDLTEPELEELLISYR